MDATKRKVSPRAPSLALDEAIARTGKMYKEEGRHAAPVEVAMKHIGYSSKNGAAMQAVASLRYWGLVERPKDGYLMVTKAFEDLEFTPDEGHKQELLIGFLKKPALFAELLEKYQDRLPSDATIKFDLIQRGFIPATADACLAVFRRSVEFARYYEATANNKVTTETVAEEFALPASVETKETPPQPATGDQEKNAAPELATTHVGTVNVDLGVDRIPIRLAGGRRAWLEIPTPFFSADKKRLKKHIDLILTDDEDDFAEEADDD